MRLKEPTAGAGPAMGRVIRRPLALLPALGPGLIAGASDNDPTTVATLAVIGFTTGYGLAWLVILAIPMLVVVQVVSTSVGVGVAYVGVNPIRLLFVSGIAGGLATPVTLAFMMLAARDRRVMGDHPIGGRLAAAGWLVTAVVTTASVLYLRQTVAPAGH